MSDALDRCCQTCRFWERRDCGELYPCESEVGHLLSDTHEGLEVGDCRRMPPVVSDEQARCALGTPMYTGHSSYRLPLGVLFAASLWPLTMECDWCGEWQPAPGAAGSA